MSLKKYLLIAFMFLNFTISLILFNHYSLDLILSYSIIVNYILSFIFCYKFSPDNNILKLVSIYLFGFGLFICGRFFANVFFVGDVYCIDFGFFYCLSHNEKLESMFLINMSLIFFVYGFLNNKLTLKTSFYDNKVDYFNKNTLFILSLLSVFLGLYVLYGSYSTIITAINEGYMSIFSNQDGVYSTPILLIIFTLFVAILSLQYSFVSKYKFCKFFFRVNVFIYSIIMLSSILQGSRAAFITGLIFLLWLYLLNRKIKLKTVFFPIFIIILIFLANDLASLSGARDASSANVDVLRIVLEDMLYNQGITMMVFNVGFLNNDYPLLAYLKVLLPGIQVLYGFFHEINNSHLTFSSYLLYQLDPSVFSDGFGLGWSLLGDFYAFSFGFFPLFLFYNYCWGKIIFKVSDSFGNDFFYNGLFICFVTQVFMLSRSSISILWALIIFYSILYVLIKVKVKS